MILTTYSYQIGFQTLDAKFQQNSKNKNYMTLHFIFTKRTLGSSLPCFTAQDPEVSLLKLTLT